MKHRRKAAQGNQSRPGQAGVEQGDRVRRRYGRLAVTCVGAALVIAFMVAFLAPLDDSVSDPAMMVPPQQTPSIALPAVAVEVKTEVLRTELLEIGTKLLEEFPQVPAALHVVALLYADLQKTTEAERIWKACIDLSPGRVGPYIGLATASMELGRDEEAVETLEEALSAGYSAPEVYHQLGAALTKLGKLEDAERVIRLGLAQFPQKSDAWLQLGQVQLQLGQSAEAEASLKKAIALGTGDGSVYFSLATVCARQGRSEEAAKYRQQFSERKATRDARTEERFQDRYDTELRQIAVAAMCRAGTVYERQAQLTRAEELFMRACGLDPESLLVCGELSRFYREQSRIADALLVQLRLVEVDPDNSAHFINLANLSSQLGDFEQAEQALKQALVLRPDAAIGYSSLAQLYLQMGNFPQARFFAEAALRQHAGSVAETVSAYYVLSEACRLSGDDAAAEAALRKAGELAAEQPPL